MNTWSALRFNYEKKHKKTLIALCGKYMLQIGSRFDLQYGIELCSMIPCSTEHTQIDMKMCYVCVKRCHMV